MKEQLTLQRLMQEGWIPVLTGILSVGAIISLECSISLAYAAALPVITLLFGAIAAKHVMQRTFQHTGNVKTIKGLGSQCENVLLALSRQIGLIENHIWQAAISLNGCFTCFAGWLKAMHAGHGSCCDAMAADEIRRFSAEIRRRLIDKTGKINAAIRAALQFAGDCAQEDKK